MTTYFGSRLLPFKERHINLDVSKYKRVLVVGDIHGCYYQLIQLLQESNYNHNDDLLISVGDIVRKGPKTQEVVNFFQKNNILAIRGNNEERLLNDIFNEGKNEFNLSREMINYIDTLPYTIKFNINKKDYVVVHAGLDPNRGLPKMKEDSDVKYLYHMVKMRNICDNGKIIPNHKEGVPWIEKWQGPEHIIFGHDAYRKLQISEFATGLDTGCCYGDDLSCLILEHNKNNSLVIV